MPVSFSLCVHRMRWRHIFCVNSEYILGEWQNLTVDETRSKLYPCCAGHNDVKDYDTEVCKMPVNHEYPLYGKHMQSHNTLPRAMGNGCSCIIHDLRHNVFNKEESVLPMQKYEWKTTTCEMATWNSAQFCEVLQDRTILLVGDSTMQQTFVALYSRLFHDNASCLSLLNFEMSDNIVWCPDDRGEPLVAQWKKHPKKANIVIFGVGPHIFESAKVEMDDKDKDSFMDFFFPKLRSDLAFFGRRSDRPDKIVYKTQNPAHIDCQYSSSPVLDPAKLKSERVANEYRYPWYLGPMIDEMIINAMKNVTGFDVIDMSPLDRRIDAHAWVIDNRDCLHYCVNGAIDVFSDILFHKMVMKEI